MKFEKEVNIYADNAIAKRFKASETSLEIVQGKIEALISESELIELQNGGKTMYSQLASAMLTLDALSLNFSDLTTKYDGLSEQYTELDSKVAEYKLGVDGLSATIASVQETLEEDYSTTLQMNAAIKASVDELSSTISRNYVTNDKLSGYSTTEQMQSAIDQKANEISTSVSQTYATKTALDDAKLDAISSANTNTAELLKNYSTTVQMNSAISQKANEITTMVSQTYVTTSKYNDLEETVDIQYTTISSKYTQLADKFTWVVSGGTSSSNFTITSRLAELVANDINLHGRVTFNGLDSSTRTKITNSSNVSDMVKAWTGGAVSTTTQINGGWIKTNTITADKIALGDFTNYATDGAFELGVYSNSGSFSIVTSQKHAGTKSLKMAAGANGFTVFNLNQYKNFPVTAGERIYVSWWGRRENANQGAGINIQIVDQNGNNLHYDIGDHLDMGSGVANNTWIQYSYVGYVQSTGYALVQFKKRADGTLSGNWYVDDVVVRRMTSGELIVSGSITADKLSVTSLESISARIGGWTISGNNFFDDKTNFMVRIAAPTEYGGDGNGNADVLVVRDKTNDTYPLVISSNGQVLATRCKFEGGTIGGWTITATEIYCNAGENSCGLAKYGTSLAFWAGATYSNRNNAKWRVWHSGEMMIDEFLHYSPDGWSTSQGTIHFQVGNWQIKTTYDYHGYDVVTYWDTPDTQENGICSHGPWVVWGGWNGGASTDVANYKFVVTDQGVCKAMSWVTGSRAEWKENIVPYHKSALQEIMNSDVYYYNLKDKGRGVWQEGRHIGFVIGDQYNVSSDILDGSGGSIDMYSALAIAYKAIQEQQQEIEMLKNKLLQS